MKIKNLIKSVLTPGQSPGPGFRPRGAWNWPGEIKNSLLGIFGILTFSSCSTIPDGVKAVTPFDKEKYLEKWFEIARMDLGIVNFCLSVVLPSYKLRTWKGQERPAKEV